MLHLDTVGVFEKLVDRRKKTGLLNLGSLEPAAIWFHCIEVAIPRTHHLLAVCVYVGLRFHLCMWQRVAISPSGNANTVS